MNSYHISPPPSNGSEDNWNRGLEGFFTGNWSPLSTEISDSLPSNEFLETPPTPNSLDQTPQSTTYGRTTPGLTTPSSSLGSDSSAGMRSGTGNRYGTPPRPVILVTSTSPRVCSIIELSNRSPRITWSPQHWNELYMSSGDRLERVRAEELGQRPERTHTLKIRGPNSGAVIRAAQTWSWTSSGVESTSDISSGGSIDTPYSLRSRAVRQSYGRTPYGSLPISAQMTGTQHLTSVRRRLFYAD